MTTAFTAPVDDILFSLNHVADARTLAGWDDTAAKDIITHFAGFAEDVLAPLNEVGDRIGAKLVNGKVRMPEGFHEAYRQLADHGWQGLTIPEEFGGMAASPLISAGVSEIFSGANHALQMVCTLVPGAVTTLRHSGTDAQQNRWIPKLASGELLSTMCLTEAHAGSDLSTIRCTAVHEEDGRWSINGEKIFISGGGQDLSQGILHLVLARSGAREDGLKGLSLYLCTDQAGVTVTRVEEKMGIHASPTCQMRFDDATAELIGEEGRGLHAMFTLMNYARLDVSLQGVAHAARAHHLAKTYAEDRMQGRNGAGGPARIADHADIRRMLDDMASLALGGRGMCHIAHVAVDQGNADKLADFLTPLCKIFCSNAGITSADLGMQILGGYGYLREYGMEQIWRDARITAIYEGANGIHEKSIATRLLRPEEGSDAFAGLIEQLSGDEARVLNALQDWKNKKAFIIGEDDPLPHAHDFAQATAHLFYKASWAKICQVADAHHDGEYLRHLAERVLTRQDG